MAKKKRAPRPPVDETFDALVIAMEDAERSLVRRLDTGAEIWFVTLEGPELVLGRRVRLHADERARDPGDEEETWIGETLASTVDPTLWNRPPLALRPRGTWDPKTDLVREDDDAPLTPDEQALVDAGPRPAFEMEAVLPGGSHENPYEGPYYEALDRLDAGEWEAGEDQLWRLVERDPRCILANNELGRLQFDQDDSPEGAAQALPVYEVSVAAGEQALPPGFDGVLSWGELDNRPFLRALHVYGLCLWRLERFDEALAVFRRMLRLNPDDNQGIRFLVESVEAREQWKPLEDVDEADDFDEGDVDEVGPLQAGCDHIHLDGDSCDFHVSRGAEGQPSQHPAMPDLPSPYRALFAGAHRPDPDAPSAPLPPRVRPGRNEPCWCGSGKKYKQCHLDRDA